MRRNLYHRAAAEAGYRLGKTLHIDWKQDVATIIGGIGTSHAPTIGVASRTIIWPLVEHDPRGVAPRIHRRREKAMTDAGLTDEEKDMIRRLDWIGLVRY